MNMAVERRQYTRDDYIKFARVKLFEARRTIHREWRITLQEWAFENTRQALAIRGKGQMEMF